MEEYALADMQIDEISQFNQSLMPINTECILLEDCVVETASKRIPA